MQPLQAKNINFPIEYRGFTIFKLNPLSDIRYQAFDTNNKIVYSTCNLTEFKSMLDSIRDNEFITKQKT